MAALVVEDGKAKAAGIVGVFLLVMGFAVSVCGFVWIGFGGGDGTGLWSGFGMLAAGALGLYIMLKKNKTAMIFYLVLCILEVILMAVQCVIALIAYWIWHAIVAVVENNCSLRLGVCYCGSTNVPLKLENCSDIYSIKSTFLAVCVLSGFGAVFALAGSVIGCATVCCGKSEPQSNVVVIQQPISMAPMGTSTTGAAFVPQQGQPVYGQPGGAVHPQGDPSYPIKGGPVATGLPGSVPYGDVAPPPVYEAQSYPISEHNNSQQN